MAADFIISVTVRDDTKGGAEKARISVRGIGDEAEGTAKRLKNLTNTDFGALVAKIEKLREQMEQIESASNSFKNSFLGNLASDALQRTIGLLREGVTELIRFSGKSSNQ